MRLALHTKSTERDTPNISRDKHRNRGGKQPLGTRAPTGAPVVLSPQEALPRCHGLDSTGHIILTPHRPYGTDSERQNPHPVVTSRSPKSLRLRTSLGDNMNPDRRRNPICHSAGGGPSKSDTRSLCCDQQYVRLICTIERIPAGSTSASSRLPRAFHPISLPPAGQPTSDTDHRVFKQTSHHFCHDEG